jgi:alkylated DNA nucleotide flippase Atl1
VVLPTPFAERVLDVVAMIPEGRVLAYGDVARLLGEGGPRAVGTVLARFGGGVPWHRVVRADGSPPPGHETEAVRRWRAERTPLRASRPRVDMARARWEPDRSRRIPLVESGS